MDCVECKLLNHQLRTVAKRLRQLEQERDVYGKNPIPRELAKALEASGQDHEKCRIAIRRHEASHHHNAESG